MQIIRAAEMGMCFGVRDALEIALNREDAAEISVYGELVHNPVVQERLDAQGYQSLGETQRADRAARRKLLITAHGISNRERQRLEDLGHELIDTTCPLVQKAHNAGLRLQAAGYFPVIIGRPGHVEVEGLTGDLEDCAVIPSVAVAEVLQLEAPRLGVLAQTTTPPELVDGILAVLRRRFPERELRFVDTVCAPTKARQEALEELLDQIEHLVVVGGPNSNNTAALRRRCEARGLPCSQISGPEELRAEDFVGLQRVGLTAGTSTLEETVAAVEAALRSLATPRRRQTGS